MSETPANLFAAPDGRASASTSDPGPAAPVYGQPAGGVPAYGTPTRYPAGGRPAYPPPYGPGAPPYGGAYPPPHGHPYTAQNSSNRMAISAMTVGIVSIPLFYLLVPSVVGLTLGVTGLSQTAKGRADSRRSMARTGLVTSIVSLVMAAVFYIYLFVEIVTAIPWTDV